MARKVIVTGGAGFLGSHLCEKLLQSEENIVICVDNLYCGYLENIKEFFANKNFYFMCHDVIDSFLLPLSDATKLKMNQKFEKAAIKLNAELISRERIISSIERLHEVLAGELHQIYNLACAASPVYYQYKPIHTLKTSVIGTINCLDLAEKYSARFLFTSTSEVYGNPLEHPQRESYFGHVNPNGIRACYDEGKRAAESVIFDYFREKGTDIRIARLFNSFGPRMAYNDGRVVSNFIVQSLRGNPLTIFGDGSQTRSFCYCLDTVEAIYRLMNQTETMGPVNIGSSTEWTIKYLAECITNLVDPNLKVEYHPLPFDDPTRRQPDISNAKKFLGWEPTVPIEEGIKRTIEYFRVLQQKGVFDELEGKYQKKIKILTEREEKEKMLRNS